MTRAQLLLPCVVAFVLSVSGEVDRELVDLSADFSIDKGFYINVEGDSERREWVEDVLKVARVPSERIAAFTPTDFVGISGRKDVEKVVPPTSIVQGATGYQDASSTVRGSLCSDLSHRLAYLKVAEQEKDGWYLVTEDDIAEVGMEFRSKMIQAMKKVPADFCMLRLGYIGHVTEEDRVKGSPWYYANRRYMAPPDDDFAIIDTAYYGAHAVLLRKDKARQLVDAVKNYPLHSADRWTANDRLDGACPSYMLGENLVKQKGKFPSTRRGESEAAKALNPAATSNGPNDSSAKNQQAVKLLQPPPTNYDDLHVLSV